MKGKIDLSQKIALKATELGFKLFGITSPSPPENYSIFENWLAQKHFGDMQYLNTPSSKDKRRDPTQLFPECKSIISVGLPYDAADNFRSKPWKVARFSQQPDYHQIIREKLSLLLEFIILSTDNKTNGQIYCDTSPILEKEIAQRAGLGKIGKNSLLISSKYGSFFNLGELFLNIELPFSEPNYDNPCIGCNLCLQSCPTSCIGSNSTIKADQCISYLTIEHKSIIPRELRSLMDSWIYGCDICQLVCPWNQNLIHGTSMSPDYCEHSLIRELESFSELWFFLKMSDGSIISNRGVQQKILRNFAICLGNSHKHEAIFPLKRLFFEEDQEIRTAAAWALGQIPFQESKDFLITELKKEKNQLVIAEILEILNE